MGAEELQRTALHRVGGTVVATIKGHTVLEAADFSVAEAAMPKLPRWPRWALLAIAVGIVVRIALKDMEMGWTRALQIYLFSIASVLLAMLFGLGRWLTVRPSPEQIMARLGLVTQVLTIELDEEGVLYGSQGKHAWSEFRHFVENDRAFLLHGDAQLLHMIPKRAFCLDDLVAARSLMESRVERKLRL